MSTAKKVAAKKPVAKKTGAKTGGKKPKRVIAQAYGGQCFWTNDGSIISNLIEFRDILDRISKDVYTYHVTKDKNDFADWIEHVLGDSELATSLRGVKTPKSAKAIVVRRLKIYDV
jgi:hypothetical protein